MLLSAPPAAVALQVLLAGMGGAGYAALALRTNSLRPGIVVHACYDLAFRVTSLEPGSWHANAYYTLHGVGGVVFAVILPSRHRFRQEVDSRFEQAPLATDAAPNDLPEARTTPNITLEHPAASVNAH